MLQKPWEENLQKEDIVSSVWHFREGLSDQDWTKHDRFSKRGDGDQHSESWVSGVVGMETRLKLSSDRIS